MTAPGNQQDASLAAPPAPSQGLPTERSLVPAGHCHQRKLSALSQQQLSRDIERDVLQGLPLELRPSGIESSGPLLRVQRVKGDSRALDVTVVHSFRAHFDADLPASPGPASPTRPGVAAAAAAEARHELKGGRTGSGLRVEELPHSGSDSLGAGSGQSAGGRCPPESEANAPSRLACRVEMPDSPRGCTSTSTSTSSGGSVLHTAPAEAAAAALAVIDISRSSSGASMAATPSATGEPSARLPSAAEPGSTGLESEPSAVDGAAAAAGVVFHGQQSVHDAPVVQAPKHQQAQQAEQLSAAVGAGTPAAPPATWQPASAAAAEVQRRFLQDQTWEGLQQQRLAMARQDSLMPFEINPRDLVVGERLALGGFAEVFAGRYQGTAVAIKLLLSVDEQGQESFRSEVHLLERLRHPNIVLFMGVCTRPYLAIVSEYMARGSLFRLLRRDGGRPLPPKLQLSVAVAVARGMAYLHSRTPPLLHLDLKSPNILLDDRWRVKIADFGLSRLKSNASGVQGTAAGTPEWMAPEVLRSEAYDERADVYSYGVVLWECLTGQQPWQGLHPMQVVAAVGFQGRQLPTEGLQGDPVLVSLCRRCMAGDPRQRPTFPEILEELEANHAHRAGSDSNGSQAPDEAGPAAEPAEAGARNGAPLRLPAAAMGQRGGQVADEEVGARQEQYGGHDDSPFAPAGPPSVASLQATSSTAVAASSHSRPLPSAAQQQQQQQQQQQPSPFEAAATPAAAAPGAAAAGMLHPAYSITNDSPFAQLPPFGSGSDDDDEAGGLQHALGSGPGGFGDIPEGSSTGGPGSKSAQQQDSAAAAAEVAAGLSQQLQSCRLSGQLLMQHSTSGEAVSGASPLSSGGFTREPGYPLVAAADVVGCLPAAAQASPPSAGRRES